MNRTTIARSIAAVLLGSTVLVTTAPALAHSHGEGGHRFQRMTQMTDADRAQMRERMQARLNQRLERLAARLEIKASQQDAWGAYRAARASIFEARPQRPARDADAATWTRFRADMAQRRAQHLATMADATAKLQEALEPPQRKVLDEIARQSGPRGRHHGQRHGGRHGGERHGFGGSA